MARTTTSLDLALNPPASGTALSQWLYTEVRSAILDGRLKPGMRLPSTRELARRYGVSRGTVVTTFEMLQSEGYVEGKAGAGTRVGGQLPDDLLEARSGPGSPGFKSKFHMRFSRYAQRIIPAPDTKVSPPRPFRALTPAFDSFPLALWTRIASRRLRLATRSLLADVDPRGYRPLRQAVADYLGSARGVKCTVDRVIIVAGIQQALDLTARLVLDPGDEVVLEDPCASIVADMFRAMGMKIVPVAVDRYGIDVDQGRRRSERAKLIYVTPAHQFPLGMAMAVNRRLALLDWAHRSRALIFEDDYDSEYRYAGRPIPALQGLDRAGSVIFAGSFSKILFPSLRLGYMVVPADLVDKFAAVRLLMDRHSSVIDQAILCDFITQGHFGSHIRRMRELYAQRRAALLDAVKRKLGGALDMGETEAGIHTIGWLGTGLNARAVAAKAAEHKIEVLALSQFSLEAPQPEGLLLGFAAFDARELRRGVDSLTMVIEECRCDRREGQ